jgi:hypothetical protein
MRQRFYRVVLGVSAALGATVLAAAVFPGLGTAPPQGGIHEVPLVARRAVFVDGPAPAPVAATPAVPDTAPPAPSPAKTMKTGPGGWPVGDGPPPEEKGKPKPPPKPAPAAAPPAASAASHGVAALVARGAGEARRYFLLRSARDGARIAIFSAEGQRLAEAPAPRATAPSADAAAARDAQLLFPGDFDVDATGRIIVADRAANAVKVYSPAGALTATIPVTAPLSVTVLPENEFAVTSTRADKLVQVYALRPGVAGAAPMWRLVREFGDPAEITDTETARELNRVVNIGRLGRDTAGNVYYAFSYLPEPTIRKYDRFGYLSLEVALTTPDFAGSAQSVRGAIERLRQSRYQIGAAPQLPLKRTVDALGVDPETQEMWVALGTLLLHFDAEGARKRAYRTYTAEGLRVEPTAIVVEPDRLLISSATLGVFEFPRPDKPAKKE